MTINNIVDGFKILKEKGLQPTQINEEYILYTRQYQVEHHEEFHRQAMSGSNLNAFFDKQDLEFKKYCLGYSDVK